MPPLHVVALGSSFAAGPGIEPQALRAAGRSEQNYAHLLAQRLGAQLTDLSVSGATLKNVLSEPQELFGTKFKPQLSDLPPEVDIVTITGGGNDFKYVGEIMKDCLQASFFGRTFSRLFSSPFQVHQESLTPEDVAERFIDVIDKVRETSPRCHIFLVEYLTLFGSHTRPGIDVPLDEAQIEHHKSVASNLQVAFKLAAEARSRCKVIPVAEVSNDHGVGSQEPWVDGFGARMLLSRKMPFHPNIRGMEAVAQMLYEELKDDDLVLQVQKSQVTN
jgi:lysophospholipase L1-like esterase